MITIYLGECVFLALLLIIVILIVVSHRRKVKLNELKEASEQKIKDIFKERWEKEQKDFKLKKTELIVEEKEIEGKLIELKSRLKEKEERYNEVNQDLDKYKADRLKDVNTLVKEKEKERLTQLEAQLAIAKEKTETEIQKLNSELEDIRSRREAVNEEILRQRKIVDNEDFYRIQVDMNSLSDISLLRNIAPRLIHPEAVNKLIWTSYYQKPLAELRKRLLPNGDYSGIYKITRLKTGEIYIGQTTSIDKRFQDHCKSALGVGTLASSTLHRLMAKDGPENFSFEIIEKVDKDKLKEKEAFYIDFYDSKNYGMNTINGAKNGTK